MARGTGFASDVLGLKLGDVRAGVESERIRMQLEQARLDREHQRGLEDQARIQAASQMLSQIPQSVVGALDIMGKRQQHDEDQAREQSRFERTNELNLAELAQRDAATRAQVGLERSQQEAAAEQRRLQNADADLNARMGGILDGLTDSSGKLRPDPPAGSLSDLVRAAAPILTTKIPGVSEELPGAPPPKLQLAARAADDSSAQLDRQASGLVADLPPEHAQRVVHRLVRERAEELHSQNPALSADQYYDRIVAGSVARAQAKAEGAAALAESEAKRANYQANADSIADYRAGMAAAAQTRADRPTGNKPPKGPDPLPAIRVEIDALDKDINRLTQENNNLTKLDNDPAVNGGTSKDVLAKRNDREDKRVANLATIASKQARKNQLAAQAAQIATQKGAPVLDPAEEARRAAGLE